MPPTTETQISAFISNETKEEIEQYTRRTGVKKNHLIEQALRHYLLAARELPADVVIPPRIVLSASAGRKFLATFARPPKPTKKLVEMMGRDDDD